MALLSGAGAVMIALLMVGSAAAASANTTLHPRFHGVVAPNENTYVNGCGSSAKLGHATFKLRTGLAQLQFSGKAGACKKVPKGFNFYSDADAGQGFEAVIALPHATNMTTNVSAAWAGKYSYNAALTTGSKTNSCPGASQLNYQWINDTEWEWGYNASSGFAGYAYSDIDFGFDGATHTWFTYNSTYNVASVPSPFYLNSTTYYYHDSFSEVYSSAECSSYASWDIQTSVQVCDTSGGFCWYETGSTGYIFQYAEIGLTNDIFYEGPSNYSYWEGPFGGYGYNSSSPGYNGNVTGSTWEYENETSTSFTFVSGGTPNATSISAAGVVNLAGQSSWANYSATYYASECATYGYYCINNGDHLYAEIFVDASMSATNENWAHGSSSFAFNGATLGNGIKLVSISY